MLDNFTVFHSERVVCSKLVFEQTTRWASPPGASGRYHQASRFTFQHGHCIIFRHMKLHPMSCRHVQCKYLRINFRRVY